MTHHDDLDRSRLDPACPVDRTIIGLLVVAAAFGGAMALLAWFGTNVAGWLLAGIVMAGLVRFIRACAKAEEEREGWK